MKSKGFKIPEHYFEEKKLALEQIAESKNKPKLRWLYLSSAAAAAILLALFLGWPEQEAVNELNHLPLESLSAYLQTQEELYLQNPQYRNELYGLGDSLDLNTLDSTLILDYLDESTYLYENYTL